MNKFFRVVFLSLVSVIPVAALAANEMKPGLWQLSIRLTQEHLASLPKDMTLPGLVGNVLTTQSCISAKDAEALLMLSDEDGDFCTITNKQVTGKTYSADIICKSEEKTGRGRLVTTFKDGNSFTAVKEFRGTVFGHAMTQSTESTGKWLSANCGAVD